MTSLVSAPRRRGPGQAGRRGCRTSFATRTGGAALSCGLYDEFVVPVGMISWKLLICKTPKTPETLPTPGKIRGLGKFVLIKTP